jgi:hypothetical protein
MILVFDNDCRIWTIVTHLIAKNSIFLLTILSIQNP